MSARGWERIDPAYFRDDSGTLGVVEAGAGLPFAVKRVFWLFGVPGEEIRRGDHAHAALRQVLVCARGRCRIDLESRSGIRETVELAEGGAGLLLDGPVWRTMHGFSPDAALMVLCDRAYADDRVIRSRAEFAAL
ncbi:MAG: FdtA/QdtA family cupin domain-containing protein [Novosphingobium sp.]|uniref:sugar 3,4-ketoisomerase n=1 Tax=Novosphingobium sp. TaxID=1874826 RepID=UPI001854231C|nr:FdtA/QdtA family cupin domain-containing protein [Novosphingobium sp.]